MDSLDLSLTLAPPRSRLDKLEENNLTLSLGRTMTVPPPQSSPPLSAVPTVEGEEPLRVQPNTPEEVISPPFSTPLPPYSAERSSLLARASPMVPPIPINRHSLPQRLSCSPCPSSLVPSSSQEATSLQASDYFGRATARPSPITYTTAPAPLSTVVRTKTPTPPSSPVESEKDYSAVVHTVEPPSLSWPLSPRPSSTVPNSTKKWTSLRPSVDRCNLFKRATSRETDARFLALCARHSSPPQSSSTLSAVPTVDGEEPLRVQPNTTEEVISSPFAAPLPRWSAERSNHLARTSLMLPTTAVNPSSRPPRFSCSPRPSSVVPSSSQEVTSLQASDHFGRATAGPSPITYTTALAPLSTVVRIKTPTPPSSPVKSQKDYSAVAHTVEPQPISWLLSPRPSSAVPNSGKESTSLPASVYRCNIFERATSLPSGPSQITYTTAVRTVQNLSFSLSPVQIQNFDPGSSSRTTDPRVLSPSARNSPQSKGKYASTSGNLTINRTDSPQPIVWLQPPGPPPEVPVPPPVGVPGAADIKGMITETKDALLARGIQKISGAIKCEKCKSQSIIALDLPKDLSEMAAYIIKNKMIMEKRTCNPPWYYLNLLNCPKCSAISTCSPVLGDSVHHVSWLFLFLGKLLGFCTKKQLYFYWKSVNPECKEKEKKLELLCSVYSHILGLLDPRRFSPELSRCTPPASAGPTISRPRTDDFGAYGMEDTKKNPQG